MIIRARSQPGRTATEAGPGDDELVQVVQSRPRGDRDREVACDTLILSRREQRLLMRFYGNMTQAQIGISQMHVSRLLSRALDYLHDKIAEPAAVVCLAD